MNRQRFDALAKACASTPLPRSTVLRLLAASGAVVAGLTLAPQSGLAKRKTEKKVRVCKCPTADAATCKIDKVKKSQARKVARRECNYRGRCQAGVSGCPAAALAPVEPCAGRVCSPDIGGDLREGCCAGYFCNPEVRRCETCRPVGGTCSFQLPTTGQTQFFCCNPNTQTSCLNGKCVNLP